LHRSRLKTGMERLPINDQQSYFVTMHVSRPLTRAQSLRIRLTKWLSARLPARLVYRILIRRSTLERQPIFREAFRLADPSRNAVDIGANRGIVSFLMSSRFPRVHSFEPNAELAGFLAKVLPANCTLHRCALSDHPGESLFAVAMESGIPIHGRGRLLEDPSAANPQATQSVRLETLDAQDLGDVGLIKIDVEGHEEKVIRGALETLRKNRPVLVVEIERRHTGKPVRDTLALVESLGYAGWFFEGESKRPTDEYREEMQEPGHPHYVNDFLFVPR
jgi:FkbM family methyltransferase